MGAVFICLATYVDYYQIELLEGVLGLSNNTSFTVTDSFYESVNERNHLFRQRYRQGDTALLQHLFYSKQKKGS